MQDATRARDDGSNPPPRGPGSGPRPDTGGWRARAAAADRRLGARVRSATGRVGPLPRLASIAAGGLGPAFRVGLLAALVPRSTRATAAEAALAAELAARTAALARMRVGRARPGPREEPGFPSRHAAASAAIATVACARSPRIGAIVAAAAVLGSLARVATAEHEPADVIAGGLLGVAAALVVRSGSDRIAWRR